MGVRKNSKNQGEIKPVTKAGRRTGEARNKGASKSRAKAQSESATARSQTRGRKRHALSDPVENIEDLEPSQRIWQVVAMIPKGQVATYGQLARLAGMPRHARLVGRTLANLPPRSRLPWHRVVNAQLRISNLANAALQQKRLRAEGVELIGLRVARSHHWDTG